MSVFKEEIVEQKHIRRKTIIALFFLVLFFCCCIAVWKYINVQPDADGVAVPLRSVLDANEKVFETVYSNDNLVPEYPKEMAAKRVRVNGNIGMTGVIDSAYRLFVLRSMKDTLRISIAEIKAMPKTEIIFDFKCVEGWSQISHWGGVRLSDFMKHYNLGTKNDTKEYFVYTGMVTVDHKYYVGLDMPSCLHPQTILCYEMNGLPLPDNQGYPLRLIMPVKYGIKSIKKIGTIFFSDSKPRDYWAERGYDYFAGL